MKYSLLLCFALASSCYPWGSSSYGSVVPPAPTPSAPSFGQSISVPRVYIYNAQTHTYDATFKPECGALSAPRPGVELPPLHGAWLTQMSCTGYGRIEAMQIPVSYLVCTLKFSSDGSFSIETEPDTDTNCHAHRKADGTMRFDYKLKRLPR